MHLIMGTRSTFSQELESASCFDKLESPASCYEDYCDIKFNGQY